MTLEDAVALSYTLSTLVFNISAQVDANPVSKGGLLLSAGTRPQA